MAKVNNAIFPFGDNYGKFNKMWSRTGLERLLKRITAALLLSNDGIMAAVEYLPERRQTLCTCLLEICRSVKRCEEVNSDVVSNA